MIQTPAAEMQPGFYFVNREIAIAAVSSAHLTVVTAS